MAVYTEINDEELKDFLAGYDIGRVLSSSSSTTRGNLLTGAARNPVMAAARSFSRRAKLSISAAGMGSRSSGLGRGYLKRH